MTRIATFLWFDGDAEEAASFYAGTFPDSRIDRIVRSPLDLPGGGEGQVLIVELTLLGRAFIAMNGGAGHPFTDAVSIMVETDDQSDTDRLWDAIVGNGGKPVACGWCQDRWGLSWQITPRALMAAIGDPDPSAARRAMEAMMTMVKIDIAAVEAARAGTAG